VVPIALARNGDLLSFGGDAILVAFDGPHHASAAAVAAWEMQQAMKSLDLDDVGLPDPPRLQMKIGLASGPLVLASVGMGTRQVALPLGSVLDATDAMANATAAGGIRLDARTVALVAPIAHLAPQSGGSALLLGLRDVPLLAHAGAPGTASVSIGDLVARIIAMARYIPQSILASLVATPQAAPGYGEQRYVVSLFSHLGGLHTLADAFWSIEPGLVAKAADLALNRAMALIEGYGGVLARVDIYSGGHKLLALFGAPVAHEQEATRAILAALALRDSMPNINAEIAALLAERQNNAASAFTIAQPALTVRSGINAGPVVAGLVGSPLRWEYTVMGDAVNVSARLMGQAQAGEVLARVGMRAMAGAGMDAEARTLVLKGKREPVQVWSVRALQLGNHSSPLQDMQLVGREFERETFHKLGEALRSGRAGVVFVQGEAGIGKTRLVRELPAILGPDVICIQTGSPGLVPVSFGVFRNLVSELCRTTAGSPTPLDPDQLRAAVAGLCPEQFAEIWPAIAILLGISAIDPAGFGGTAEAQQRLLADAVQKVLAGAADRQPLAWICEDLHEADDASLAVMEQLLAIGWSSPVLLCATLRTTATTTHLAQRLAEIAAQQFQGTTTSLDLSGLSHDAGDTLLESLLPGLAPSTRAALHSHTTGNPLFLQVLAQTVSQQRMLTKSSQGLMLSGSLMALDVPRTLRELVAAQVDRLPAEVRRLAQVAAVIAVADRTVPQWLLEQMADEPDAVLPRLAALARAHVIDVEPTDLMPAYVFRHALYQQAAYEQLLERERQELHRRAGLALHGQQDGQEAPVEALAYHCYEGHCWELALEYSLAAGQRALQSYANREARRLLRRSLGLARRLGLARHEAEAREGLGKIYLQYGRYAPAQAQFARALQRGAVEGDQTLLESLVRRHRLLAMIAEETGEYDKAEAHCRTGLTLAQALAPSAREVPRLYEQLAVVQMRRGDLDGAEKTCRAGLATITPDLTGLREHVQLLLLLGTFDGQRGNYHSAIKTLEESLSLARPLNDPSLIPPILRNLGLCFHYVGQRTRALACYQESLSIDERTGDVIGRLRAVDSIGLLYLMSGAYDAALRCFLDCFRRSKVLNMRQMMAGAIDNVGYLYHMRGDYDQASMHLLQAHTLWSELGDALSLAQCLCRMADVALGRNEADVALGYAELALEHARQVGSDSCMASALRVIGEALLIQQRLAEAAVFLERAQEVQSRVDEPFGQVLLLRAATLLALAQHDRHQARRLVQLALKLATSQEVPYLITMIAELESRAV